MKILCNTPDGGAESGVRAWGLEVKSLFSVVLLRFSGQSREAFHSHAFHSITAWIKGHVVEDRIYFADHAPMQMPPREYKAGMLKWTPRSCFHKINASETTWALSFRGPWIKHWNEFKKGKLQTLTHGREIVNNNERTR